MSTFKFYINGQELQTEPVKWDEFLISIERNEEIRFIGARFPVELTFIGDGYDIINQILDESGRTSHARIEVAQNINGDFLRVFSGIIKLSEGANRISRREWETPVRDNTFSAYIRYNLNLKINLSSTVTKGGEAITPPTALEVYPIFDKNKYYYDINVAQGVSLVETEDYNRLSVYDAFDVLEYMVAYVSDNQLTLRSNWYDGLADSKKLCLLNGNDAHVNTGTPIATTLTEFIKSLGRIFNLYLSIENGVVILEDADYFQNSSPVFSLSNVDEYESEFDRESLYSKIKVGDTLAGDAITGNNFPQIGSKREVFKPLELFYSGSDVAEGILDLQPKYIINSSIIAEASYRRSNFEALLEKYILDRNGNQSRYSAFDPYFDNNGYYDWLKNTYDNEILLLQYNSSTLELYGSLTNDQSAYIGNHEMMNSTVLSRYGLPNNLQTTESGYGTFRIYRSNESVGFSACLNNSVSKMSFYNPDNSKIYKMDGGQHIVDNGSYVRYSCPEDETKSFTVAAMVKSRGTHYSSYTYDGNPKLVDNDDGLYFLQEKKYSYSMVAGIPSNPMKLVFDEAVEGWSVGDQINLEFQGPTGSDWLDINASSYEIVAINGKVVSFDKDASGVTSDFVGGTAELLFDGGFATNEHDGRVDVQLYLYRYDSNGTTLLDTEITTYTDAKDGVVLTGTATFDLDEGDIVYPAIRILTDNQDATIQWLYVPIEFRDNTTVQHQLYTSSEAGFRGEIVKFEHPLTYDQRQDLINAPFKAVGINGGKGWPKKIDINFKTGETRFELMTNKQYFNN